ncbi:unnamed protein product [Rotaria sp. Silwood1]|nr:unnamed protein product [Rotaria sp. Silwood1]CAF1564314.1 unnamed protein product [Rotaria sp. Silwood1]
MTSNNVGKIGNFGNIVYDSDNDTPNLKRRIGVSATEVELLDDIPPALGSGITSSENNVSDKKRIFESQIPSSVINKENQSNNYQTLSFNKEQPKSNIAYQDNNDQQLNLAVDKLLEKYAPDALPQNVINTSTSRQQPSQVNVVTARDDPSFSTFQTNAPSSSTTANNYSSVIRPNKGQIFQTNTQTNNNNNNSQPFIRSHPEVNYDSTQYANSSQKPQPSASINSRNGNFPSVVPGKLYALVDDPLHIFYDRQYPTSSKTKLPSQQQQQPSFQTTFQPSNNFQTTQDPSVSVFTSTSRRNPQQPIPTTINKNSNGLESLNLENLIKRVQQDYYQEIKPYVSSVRFVEKDREYGQSLADIGFITPISVRRGFTKQADDILRRSFGRQGHRQQPVNLPDSNDYSDDEGHDDIDKLRRPNRNRPLEKFDSKQSFTSVTSVSTYSSDYDDRYSLPQDRNKINVRDQSTSPPPKLDQTKAQQGIQNLLPASTIAPVKPMTRDDTDEEVETPTTSPRIAIKPAKRIPLDQYSISSAEQTTSIDEEDPIANYNEHDNATNSRSNVPGAANNIIKSSPIVEPIDKKTVNQIQQRSEDIHPVPPTIRGPQTNVTSPKDSRIPVKRIDSDGSDIDLSDTDEATDTDDDNKPPAPNNKLPSPSITRSNVQPPSTNTPIVRPPTAPQTNTRDPTPQTNIRGPASQINTRDPAPQTNTRGPAPQTNTRDPAPQTNTRGPAPQTNTRDQAPQTNTRGPAPQTNTRGPTTQNVPPTATQTNIDNNARQAGGSTVNPTNQRNAPNERTTAAAGSTSTGSTRLFKPEANSRSASKGSVKDGSSTLGNKFKSIFRRKQS